MNPTLDTFMLGTTIPEEIAESDDFQLIDIIPLDELQSLQDKFSIANGVSSVILDLAGKPITKSSKFNEKCGLTLYPGEDCLIPGRIVRGIVNTSRKCRLMEALAPINIGGKHIADWKIAMCGFGETVTPYIKALCGSVEKFDEFYEKSLKEIEGQFKKICDLLQIIANEISEVGYNNLRLARELFKQEQIQAKLADSEITFHSIFDNSVDGIFLLTQDGTVREWSQGFEKLSGIPKDQAVGKNIWDTIRIMIQQNRYTDNELDQLRRQVENIITQKEQTTVIRHIINQETHQERIIHTYYFPVHLPEATMIGGISRDITENVERERELLAEKERLQALGDNYPNGCLYRAALDVQTKVLRFTYLSRPWEIITGGISVETALNDPHAVFNLIDPEDLPVLMGAIMKSAETMTNMNVEIRYRLNVKETKWAQVSSAPHLEDQLVVWDGYILDITDRRNNELKLEAYRDNLEAVVREQTEALQAANEELYATNEELYATNEEFAVTNEELHKRNIQLQQEIEARMQVMQKLEYNENLMRNFITQSFEGIVIIDHEGRVIEWNPEQERCTEIPSNKALGQYAWDLYKNLMSAEKEAEMTEQFYQQIQSFLDPKIKKQPEETEHVLEISGQTRYVTVTTFQIAMADKCHVGQIMQDTTERKLIDLELERYRTQLEEMVASQTRELIESKERLTSLSDNLPGGVIFQLHGKSGRPLQFSYISARFANMFHITVENVLEDCSLFFRMFHPDDQEKILDLFGSNQSGFADVECRICLNTGEIRWIQMRSSCHFLEDQSLVWDGFMVDINDRKYTEHELEETRKRQNILIKVLQIVQSSDTLADALNTALSEIGHYAEVSRTYIFEKSPDGKTVINQYEWCNEGITPEIHNLQDVPIEYVSEWFDAFDKNEYICASDIVELSQAAYEQLVLQGIKSILVLPLKVNGVVYGFAGFDECTRYKQWNQKEVELLISLTQIISSTTRRFRAEKSIQLSQQTMRTVLDNINASIYVANFDTYELLFANKVVKDHIGEDIEGKPCWSVLQHGMTGPCDFCPNSKLLDSEKKPTGLHRWEYHNQKVDRWVECSDVAIEWIDGRLVHMEYATDITDRRVAEEALRQSEELYRQLTVASPDAIVVCDPKAKVVFMSPRAKELFLISHDTDITELQLKHYVHPHDLHKSIELFQSSLAEGNVSFLPQLLLLREDGSDFFGEISSASVKDEQGQPTSIIMVIRDITERKMNEMELIRAKEKAEESDKLKSSFLANMSHEIRTPINGIVGFLNFLADDNLSPKRRHDYISVVNNSSVQLVKLIDDIIDVAKIEAKQMSLRPTLFHLNDFMRDLQVFFDTYLQANNKDKIALVLDDSQFIEPNVIFVDPMRLRQVLSNLIGNAIKFTEKGYIGFGCRPLPPDKLEFWVEDSGIGLAPNQLEIIFERFRQAEVTNSRKYGGTGLGLTISRSLVQMMGGDIMVESVENAGSTFRFTISYLPIAPEDEPLFSENIVETNSEERPFKEIAILLVVPEIMTFRYYEKLLAPTGATLIHAQTVKQWIDTISQRKHIDLALVDARVFQYEDDEALRQVRSIRAGLPLLLMVPERNEHYNRVINDIQCNRVIDGIANYTMLYHVLKKYM